MSAATTENRARAAQPSTTLERRFRVMLLTVVVLAILAYAVSEQDVLIGAALIFGAASGWFVTESGTAGRGLPRWASGLILLGVLVGAVFRTVQGVPMVSAFSTFLASIIVLKLWERRELRDYSQVLMLSLFLVIGSVLTASSVWLGLILAVTLPLYVMTVMMYQVYGASVRASKAGGDRSAPGGVAWRGVRPGLLGVTAFVVVVGACIGTVVFVLVPRGIGFEQFAAGMRPRLNRQVGFTDRVDLSQGGLISDSQVTVMEIRLFSETDERELGGPAQRQYFRGLVLDRYESGRWSRSENPSASMQRLDVGQFVRLGPSGTGSGVVIQEVRVRETSPRPTPAFAVSRPATVWFTQLERPGIDVEIDLHTSTLLYQPSPGQVVTYRVRSVLESALASEDGLGVDLSWRGRSSFPSKRIAVLAQDVLARAGIASEAAQRLPEQDLAAARVFESYLRGGFQYTLDPPTAPLGEDPTEWFIFTARRGHCEYFASALAALCRSVGIEARLAAGYLTTEFDGERRVYIVRQSNAHAWVEVRTASGSWQTMDATPPSELERLLGRQQGVMARLGRMLDRIEDTWNTRIASFDQNDQARLFGTRSAGSTVGARLVSWMRDAMSRDEAAQGEGAVRWLSWFALAGAGAGVIFVGVRRVRRRKRAGAPWGLQGDAALIYTDLVRAIERRGRQRPEWQPLLAFIDDLPDPPVRELARPAAAALYRWGFRGVAPDQAALSRIRADIAKIRRLSRA